MTGLRFGVMILIFIAALVAAPPGAHATNGDVAGTVERIKGKAIAVQDAVPRDLSEGDAVLIGDILSTGAFARIEIRMIDDGLFTLGQRSSFVVIDYSFGQGADNATLRLMQGAMRAVSGGIAQVDSDNFRVETEFGSLGVRGTEFWGGVMDDGAFHVALLGGTAVVVTTRGGRVEIAAPGFGTTIAGPDAAPSPPREWPDDKLVRAADMTGF